MKSAFLSVARAGVVMLSGALALGWTSASLASVPRDTNDQGVAKVKAPTAKVAKAKKKSTQAQVRKSSSQAPVAAHSGRKSTVRASVGGSLQAPKDQLAPQGGRLGLSSQGQVHAGVSLRPSPWLTQQPPAMAVSGGAIAASAAMVPAPAQVQAVPAVKVPAPATAYVPRPNPYLVNVQPPEVVLASAAPASYLPGGQTRTDAAPSLGSLLPHVPLFEQAILPKIKTVYPTGEKPLVVVTFKCPTELIGIDTPSTLLLHNAVNGGMDLINKSNLLSFNMQQVCQ